MPVMTVCMGCGDAQWCEATEDGWMCPDCLEDPFEGEDEADGYAGEDLE